MLESRTSHSSSRRGLQTYGIALLAIALTFALRLALSEWLNGDLGLVTFIPAVLAVTYFVGLGPGIAASAVSIIVIWCFLLPESGLSSSSAVALAAFIVGVIVSILVVDRLRLATDEATQELAQLRHLHELSSLLVRDDEDFDRVASAAVTTAMRISGAVKGNLQLFDADSGALKIAAHQGFDAGFLQFFEYVRNDGSACAAAMRSGQRIIIDDVAKSEIFAGQPSRQVMLDAQALAVISTPLMSSKNTLLGMISVHFNKPHQPRDAELHRLDLLARQVSDYLERKRAEQVETTLMRELQHRSNNLLAVVQAMAHRSFSDSGIPADAKMRFEQRLQALARANRRLTNSNWTNVDLTELVNGELEYLPARTRVTGPTVSLQAQLVQKFTLVLHELSTNAVKHGAMAVPDGTLTATWSVTHNGNGRVLCFRWEERGRSQAAAPGKGGFGAQLITTSFPEARTHYGDAGFTWEVEVPLKGDNDPAAFAALRSAIEQHTMP